MEFTLSQDLTQFSSHVKEFAENRLQLFLRPLDKKREKFVLVAYIYAHI